MQSRTTLRRASSSSHFECGSSSITEYRNNRSTTLKYIFGRMAPVRGRRSSLSCVGFENNRRIRRSASTSAINPSLLKRSSMKVVTALESVKKTYPSAPPRIKNLSVSFSKVRIQEYEATIGDNPSVSFGPPITLGNFLHQHILELDDYENFRGKRRTMSQLCLPMAIRMDRLLEAGVARRDIARAIRESGRVKSRRSKTVNNMKFSRVEEAVESSTRKMKRLLLGRKRDKEIWEDWKGEFENALVMQIEQPADLGCSGRQESEKGTLDRRSRLVKRSSLTNIACPKNAEDALKEMQNYFTTSDSKGLTDSVSSSEAQPDLRESANLSVDSEDEISEQKQIQELEIATIINTFPGKIIDAEENTSPCPAVENDCIQDEKKEDRFL